MPGVGKTEFGRVRGSVDLKCAHLSFKFALGIHDSGERLELHIRFERGVSADAARKAWREGLENKCKAPCHLDGHDVERFLDMVPAMHAGDNYTLLFRQQSAIVSVNGRQIGTVSQPQFANAMLATFLGPDPASSKLKWELLQGHG